MRQITLTKGYVAMVDDWDYERVLAEGSWHAVTLAKARTVYAMRIKTKDGRRIKQRLHRFILGITDSSVQVDHKDHDGLNNTRANLRACTHTQNMGNRRRRLDARSSKFKGLHWEADRGKWRPRIRVDGRSLHLGRFASEVDAAMVYDIAALIVFGDFAHLNFPKGVENCAHEDTRMG